MGRRQRTWAKRAYDRLLLQLGGRCALCGSLSGLSIDHIDGCTYIHSKLEWSHRISVYRREAKEGKLQVLCAKCNSKKGDPVEPIWDAQENQLDLFVYLPPTDEDCPF